MMRQILLLNQCFYSYVHVFFFSVKPENFINREFSFTLHEDIYIRYQSFNTLQEFEKEVQTRCPFKIDIGAVFNMRFVFYFYY
jgi:DNA primase small subunit